MDEEKRRRDGWNPYLAGALVGVLAVLSVVVSTKVLGKPKYLGASTTFVRAAGMMQDFSGKARCNEQ